MSIYQIKNSIISIIKHSIKLTINIKNQIWGINYRISRKKNNWNLKKININVHRKIKYWMKTFKYLKDE